MTRTQAVVPTPRESGFTLIELMIVIVLVAGGLLALSGVQTRSSTSVFSSGRQARALAIAQERIEFARGAGYAAAVSDSGASGPYLWTTRVDLQAPELKRVIVSVRWSESAGARSLQLNTLLSAR
jgi:prepilin-type N-terminal cleavage/methylation domain-containing protein